MPFGFGPPRHERSNGFGRRQQPPHHDPYYDPHHHERRGITHGVHFFGPIRFRIFGINFYFSSGRSIGIFAGFFALLVMGISIFGMFSGYKTNKQDINYYSGLIAIRNQSIAENNKTIAGLNDKFAFYDSIIDKALKSEENHYISTGIFYNNLTDAATDSNDVRQNIIKKVVYVESVNDSAYEINFIVNPLDGDEMPEDLVAILIGGANNSAKLFTTFAMYTSLTLKNSMANDYDESNGLVNFDIAVAYIDGEVYAINVDFDKEKATAYETVYYQSLNTTLNNEIVALNAEVKTINEKLKTQKVGIGILFGIVAIVVLVTILSIVKAIKKSIKKQKIEDAMAEAEIQEAQARAEEAQARAEIVQGELDRKNRYCEYCGAPVGENDTKCSNCGSVMFEVKK